MTTEKAVVEHSVRANKTLRNFGFLISGKTLGDAFVFLMFVILSRAFGQEGIGQYSFAIAFTGFFAVFAEFGLYPYSVKELARHTGSIEAYFGRILSLRFFLSAIALGVLLLIVPFLPFSYESKLIILLIGAYQVLSYLVSGIAAAFVSKEDTHLSGLIEVSLKATAALSAIAIILVGGSLVVALTALPAATGVQLLFAYWLVTRRYGRPKVVTAISSFTRLAREALPYAMSFFLVQLYTRVDVVLLGFILGAATAGVYNVAYRIVFLLIFVPHFAAISLFPLASRLYGASENEFKQLYHKSMGSIILIGFPVAAGLWLIAPDLIALIFGESFDDSAPVLRLLAGVLFFLFFSRILGVFLMSCDRQAERARSYMVVAGVSVVGNLILIPILGVNGAAVVALISELLLAILFMMRLRDVVGLPRVGPRLVIGFLGVVSFCLPFAILPSLSLGVVIPSSILLYSVTLLLFKETRTNEVRALVKLLRRQY